VKTARRDRDWAVWHAAALPLLKRFPRFADFIKEPAKTAAAPIRNRRATSAELLSLSRRWTVATGGVLEPGTE
jgi:hypothetical protein